MSLLSKLFPVAPGEFVPEDAPEWALARLGRVTASDRISRILGGKKAANTVLDELEYELRKGEPFRQFTGNWATRHGHKWEDQALTEYDMARLDSDQRMVMKPGFTVHPDCPLLGASPDFLVGVNTVGQVKCPAKTQNHLTLVYSGAGKYLEQVQCESLVTGRPKIVFLSYDARMPAAQQLATHDVEPDINLQARMLEKVDEIFQMLALGKRYTIGKLAVEAGVPKLF